MTSPTAPGVTHRWTNLRAFVDRGVEARIWAGFHYRFSTRVGAGHGPQDRRVRGEERHAADKRGGRTLICNCRQFGRQSLAAEVAGFFLCAVQPARGLSKFPPEMPNLVSTYRIAARGAE